MTAEYGNLDLTTGTFGVYNSFIYSPWLPREGLEGTGLYSASYPSGELEVSFYGKVVPEPNYLIMKTDYDTYSLMYSCDYETAFLYILSRTPVLDQDKIDELNAYAKENLPNYDWSQARTEVQGAPTCTGTYTTYY